MNVHLYFDKDQGAWVRLPLAWELHSDFVKELMATIRVMQFVLLALGLFVFIYCISFSHLATVFQ